MIRPSLSDTTERRLLAATVLLAFLARALLRFSGGEQSFIEGSYYFYLKIAQTFVGGGGLCLDPGIKCALREPVYPLLVAFFLSRGWLYLGLVIVQSAVGSALVWLAWWIGRELFGGATGLLAAVLTALNPYTIVHDTALQETVILNVLVPLAVVLLIETRRTSRMSVALCAGMTLAVAVLTTARILFFVPAALLWLAVVDEAPIHVRARQVLLVALPIVVLVGAWTIRNWRVVGAPVLTTEAGESLWVGNNATTLDFIPERSIDRNVDLSYERLTPTQLAELTSLRGQEVAQDRLKGRWGREYIAAHPVQIAWNALRKVAASASGQLSPVRAGRLQLGYAIVFVPIHVLAAIGLWRSRQRWTASQTLVALVFLSFALTTALFWAHTSHKSYLDAFLFVYAASTLTWAGRSRSSARAHAVPSTYSTT